MIQSKLNNTSQKSNSLSKMKQMLAKTKVKTKVTLSKAIIPICLTIRSQHLIKVIANKESSSHNPISSSLRLKTSLHSLNRSNHFLHNQKSEPIKNLIPMIVCSKAFTAAESQQHPSFQSNHKAHMQKLQFRQNLVNLNQMWFRVKMHKNHRQPSNHIKLKNSRLFLMKKLFKSHRKFFNRKNQQNSIRNNRKSSK